MAIKRWLDCGYQAQGVSILDLVKGVRDPELLEVRFPFKRPKSPIVDCPSLYPLCICALRYQLAVKNLPEQGNQTLYRYEDPAADEREAYDVASLKSTYALHFAALLDSAEMINALWPKMIE